MRKYRGQPMNSVNLFLLKFMALFVIMSGLFTVNGICGLIDRGPRAFIQCIKASACSNSTRQLLQRLNNPTIRRAYGTFQKSNRNSSTQPKSSARPRQPIPVYLIEKPPGAENGEDSQNCKNARTKRRLSSFCVQAGYAVLNAGIYYGVTQLLDYLSERYKKPVTEPQSTLPPVANQTLTAVQQQTQTTAQGQSQDGKVSTVKNTEAPRVKPSHSGSAGHR